MAVPEGYDPKQAHVVSQWKHDRPLNACRFDPRGWYVVCGSQDNLVERFAVADGKRTLMAGGHRSWVRSVAFTKDGSQVITGGSGGALTWWDTAADAPQPLHTIPAHKGWIRTLDVSSDGKLLASGGNDDTIRVWDLATRKLRFELTNHARNIYCVAFHPNGRFLLTGDLMGELRQWDIATGKEVRKFDAKPLHNYNGGQRVDFGGIRAIAVSPDGKHVAAGGLHKATNPLGAVHEPLVLLFNWETQKVERKHIAEGVKQGVVWRLVWMPDESLMGMSGGGSGGFLIFWKPDADKDFHRFKLPSLARDMDVHPDRLRVATAHYDRHVRITRLAAKKA